MGQPQKYRVTLSDGRRFDVTTEGGPPSEADVLASLNPKTNTFDEAVAKAGSKATGISAVTWGQRFKNVVPSITGGIGGLIGFAEGGPGGAILGAGLGGGVGRSGVMAWNRAINGHPPTPGLKAALDIGTNAAEQAGAEALGVGVLAPAARGIGRAMVENAVRPPVGLQQEFPNVIDTIIQKKLPVGRAVPGLARGSEQAGELLKRSAGNTTRLLTDATAQGMTTTAQQVAQKPVGKLLAEIAEQPLSEAETQQVSNMLAEFLKNKAGALNPLQIKAMKKAAQKISAPIYKAIAKGNMPGAEQALKARFNAAIAEGSKDALETLPGGMGAKVAASEAETQSLIGAKKALRQAEMRRLPLWAEAGSAAAGATAGALGGSDLQSGAERGVGAYLLIRALSSPRTLSRLGLSLNSKAIAQIIRQMPRSAVAALLFNQQETAGTPDTGSPGAIR